MTQEEISISERNELLIRKELERLNKEVKNPEKKKQETRSTIPARRKK